MSDTPDKVLDLQRAEHAYKLSEARLRVILVQKKNLEQMEGRIRCEMQRLENQRYRILSRGQTC